MESHFNTISRRMRLAIYSESSFEFPDFMLELRQSLGMSRNALSKALDMPYDQLFKLEKGNFRCCRVLRLKKLSNYFGVEYELLERKCREYLQKKKGSFPL